MHALLWILQVLLSVYFLFAGVVHFVLPPGLPAPMAWMYDLPPVWHIIAGTAEILAAFGLILPGLTRIQTRLTPLASLGLVLVMMGAAGWHLLRQETTNFLGNILVATVAAFVAYGRWRLAPLGPRTA